VPVFLKWKNLLAERAIVHANLAMVPLIIAQAAFKIALCQIFTKASALRNVQKGL
jgi:hypothetical protein